MKRNKIKIPIYFGFLHIVITKDFEKACKKFNIDTMGNDVNHWGAFCNRYTSKLGYLHYQVFLKHKASAAIIAHETTHLVNMIFEDRHIKLDIKNDEPQAYLTGWVSGQIHKALKK
jgi:hypothetical protein